MKDQHEKISGYRDLNQAEIDLMNEAKQLGEAIGAFIKRCESLPESVGPADQYQGTAAVDRRWLAIAKTALQKGVMFLIRAIARPTTF